MSIYPQIEFENREGSTESEFTETGPRFSLPIQAAFKAGPVELIGELGYTFVKGDSNETFYGVAVARELSPRVELLAEVFGISENRFGDNEIVFNVGTIVKLNKRLNLVSAVGRSLHREAGEGPISLATLGVQLLFKRPL